MSKSTYSIILFVIIIVGLFGITEVYKKEHEPKTHDIIAVVKITNDLGVVTEEIPVTNFSFDNDSLMFEVEYLVEGVDTPIVRRQWAPKDHVKIDALIRK